MNGLTTIQINGEPVRILFAMLAVRLWFEAIEKDKFGILVKQGEGVNPTTEGFSKLLQCGYHNYCFIKEVEPTLTLEAFVNYVDDNEGSEDFTAEATRVYTLFGNCMAIQKLIERQKKSPENGVMVEVSQ